MTRPQPAALLLEDGTRFDGYAFGATGETAGEVVFNTSMTGYQEILTDPSYRGQIVTMTYPHIGNYGVNPADVESGQVQVAGFIVRDACPTPSNWRSASSLHSYLRRAGVVGLYDIDTRALVRRIRVHGAMKGSIITGETTSEALQQRMAAEPPMQGRDLVREVTCDAPYTWSEGLTRLLGEEHTRPRPPQPDTPFKVVAMDFGVKRNILRLLVDHGCSVTVVPATTSAEAILAHSPDGVFLSNGPGDPGVVDYAVDTIKQLVENGVPIFGICLGHQLLSRALGAQTFKLKFGHRGGNQPVKDLKTGKVEITSQNHGFAVSADGLEDGAIVSHVNLNDDTVAGLAHERLPIFGVQYHPEASPGPHDADYLFTRFTEMMESQR
ncbi:MAG: glutamine-hydrolyzing carbamoyl-phosphate synthase small subunit [Bradymonadia bacterium]